MTLLAGIQVIESEFALTRQIGRVRGGYKNRWLIRGVVSVPAMYHDRAHNRLYVHPDLMVELRKQLRLEVAPLPMGQPWH